MHACTLISSFTFSAVSWLPSSSYVRNEKNDVRCVDTKKNPMLNALRKRVERMAESSFERNALTTFVEDAIEKVKEKGGERKE